MSIAQMIGAAFQPTVKTRGPDGRGSIVVYGGSMTIVQDYDIPAAVQATAENRRSRLRAAACYVRNKLRMPGPIVEPEPLPAYTRLWTDFET